MPKVSIIVPVYNMEKYIKKCLESLAKQTMQDFEIIVVNDGSKDNSEKIIQDYKERHKELAIQYVKKENGGLASARNYGIQYATGKYISFIDADDYIDQNLYQDLELYMEQNIDMIKFKMKTVNEKDEILEKIEGPVFEVCSGEDAYKKLCVEEKFLDPACIYLYRREFFMSHKFQYRLTYHEDFGLTSLIIINAKSFVSTNVYGYYYLQSDNSLTRSNDYKKDKKRANDVLAHYDNMIEKIEQYTISKQTKELVKRYYTNTVILKAETLKNEDFEEYLKEIKKRKLYQNIKPENLKQRIKRWMLKTNIKIYLKMR